MTGTSPTAEMGRLHEVARGRVLGGQKTGSSGNQWDDQLDGHTPLGGQWTFRWDGKSTLGESITITRKMLDKLNEQAQGDRIALPMRWYANGKLTEVAWDLVAIRDVDLSEILEAARKWEEVEASLSTLPELREELDRMRAEVATAEVRLENANARADAAKQAARKLSDALAEALAALAEAREGAPEVPPYIPRLPWRVIHSARVPESVQVPDRLVRSGIAYDEQGHQLLFGVSSVRVERSPDSSNRPRLVVNDLRVPDGDLYADGKLVVRVCASDPSIEVG